MSGPVLSRPSPSEGAPAVPLDTLAAIDVALSKLEASPLNVRRTARGAGIGELAASIAAHGLLQPLVVRPRRAGRFEVVAGGRRHAALLLLAARKELPKGAPVPCRVLPGDGEDGSAAEASLAENAVRLDMHPADQFEAFAALHRDGAGLGVEAIAARFGVSAHVVRQRLRLAAVSPAVVESYRAGDLSLDDVAAFAVADDREAQERVLRDLQPWQRAPATIRRLLTGALVPVGDRRVRLVGLGAYEAAGGRVQRDLFAEDGGGWIADPALLERLAGERVQAELDRLRREEGWRWAEAGEPASAAAGRCRRVWPVRAPLADDDEARRAELAERYDALADRHEGDEDLPGEVADELDRIETELDGLARREERWRPEDVALAGCAVSVGGDGRLVVTRGLVRPEDEPAPASDPEGSGGAAGRGDEAGGEGPPAAEGQGRDAASPALSAALSAELDAHRTLALRAELAARPDLALRVLVHALAADAFFGRWGETAAAFPATANAFAGLAALADSPARRAVEEAEARERAALPAERRDLWAWVAAAGTEALHRLLAVCVARVADAGTGDWTEGEGGLRLAVARAAGLDLRAWWSAADPGAYVARVPKAAILAAAREGAGEEAAARIAGLRKEAMAAEAARLLDGTGWLPARLRVPPAAGA